MNMLQKTLATIAVGSLLSVTAQAADMYSMQPYVGAKIGQYSPDVKDADNAMSYGIYGGMNFTPEFGVEAEYLTTSDADIDNKGSYTGEYSSTVYGLYGTYNYVFPSSAAYLKGKLGFAKNDIERTFKNTATNTTLNMEDDGSGVAGGIGLGYHFSPNASIEAMYNMYPTIERDNDTDVDVTGLTLGAHFRF